MSVLAAPGVGTLSLRIEVAPAHGGHLSRVPAGYYRAEGSSKNYNTIEEYQTADKALILKQAGKRVSLQKD